MAYKPLTVDKALEQVLVNTRLCSGRSIDITKAHGRVLFSDVVSDIDSPPFNTALMDGYAVRSQELENCSKTNPIQLGVVGHVGAGSSFEGDAREGHCVRIMTGAPVPEELDAIIKLEDTAVTVGDGWTGSVITYGFPVTAGQHIEKVGACYKKGDTVLSAGSIIDGPALGVLAETGNTTVRVFKKPKVTFIPIGNELVSVYDKPGFGQIRNSSVYALAGQAKEAGAKVHITDAIPDDPRVIAEALRMAARESDFIITTGGSAGGDFDYIDQVMQDIGTLIFTDVLMNPARTQGFGLVDSSVVFTLPGQPTAALAAFELFIRPALLKAGGFTKILRPTVHVRLLQNIGMSKRHPDAPLYLRARIERGLDGMGEAFVPNKKGPRQFLSLTNCNGMLILPPDPEKRRAGAIVECMRLDVIKGGTL